MKITKVEAAYRQAHTAIDLFFHDGDPISIHTLTATSYNLLRDLTKGKKWMIKEILPDHAKPGREKDLINLFNKYENFLKHADRDPDESLDYETFPTEAMLWDCCSAYRRLTDTSPHPMICYNIWFKLKNPNLVTYANSDEKIHAYVSGIMVEGVSKQEFYRITCLTLAKTSAEQGAAANP